MSKWSRRMSAERWRAELAEGLTEMEMERLRLRTHTGRPLGSDSFLSKLETALDGSGLAEAAGTRLRMLLVQREKSQRCGDHVPRVSIVTVPPAGS